MGQHASTRLNSTDVRSEFSPVAICYTPPHSFLSDCVPVIFISASLLPLPHALPILCFAATLSISTSTPSRWRTSDLIVLAALILPPLMLRSDLNASHIQQAEYFLLAACVFVFIRNCVRRNTTPLLVAWTVLVVIYMVSGLDVWIPRFALFRSIGIDDPSLFRQPLGFYVPFASTGNPVCFYLAGMGLALAEALDHSPCRPVIQRGATWCVLLGSTFLVTMSFSRAAYLGGLAILCLPLAKFVHGRDARLPVIAVWVFAVVTAVLTGHVYLGTVKGLVHTLTLVAYSGQRRSIYGHIQIIHRAGFYIYKSPFGLGTGHLKEHLSTGQGLNAYLEYCSEQGVLGIAVILVGAYCVVRRSLRLWTTKTDREFALMASVYAILGYSMVWSNLLMDKMSLIALGTLCGLLAATDAD